MVSDVELVGRLREFLSTSDLNTTTTATVRRRLQEDLGIDLSDRKAFIREQIDIYLQTQLQEEHKENEEEQNEEEEEEEEEDEEETSNGEGSSKKRSKNQNNEVKKRGGGFCKVCSLSPELQDFVGEPEMARTEVVKRLWIYIREKNLQDPSNKRNILCDDTLRTLFRVDCINMFQMNKALAKHIWPLESDNAAPVKSTQKEKQQKQEKDEAPAKSSNKKKQRKRESDEDSDEPKKKKKGEKGGTSGFLKPLPLSDAFAKFIGTGETELSRSGAVKRIWDYIKENNLQDPSDKRRILCDDKLKELFDVDSFVGFSVSKLLTNHFVKSEQ